jgi:hypothetical protein
MYDAACHCKVVAVAQTRSTTPKNDRRMKTGRLDAREERFEGQLNRADPSLSAKAVAAPAQLIHK